MKPRTKQIVISACAVPAFVFIAMNRLAIHQPSWAIMWLLLALAHSVMLIEAIWSRTNTIGGSDE